MALANGMTKLLRKIEILLGTRPYNLPAHLTKDNWPEIIDLFTLDTYSRYFPNKYRMELDTRKMKRQNGYYIIDEETIPGDIEILGIKDIAWDDANALGNGGGFLNSQQPFGLMDMCPDIYSFEDITQTQMIATQASLFSNGIYIEFKSPNKIKLTSSLGVPNDMLGITTFMVDIFVKHSMNLNTIEPTKMEVFEKLAAADVAIFLYNELKHYDNLETIFVNVELNLQDLQEKGNTRPDIENELKEGYVSAANTNQPMMYTV